MPHAKRQVSLGMSWMPTSLSLSLEDNLVLGVRPPTEGWPPSRTQKFIGRFDAGSSARPWLSQSPTAFLKLPPRAAKALPEPSPLPGVRNGGAPPTFPTAAAGGDGGALGTI